MAGFKTLLSAVISLLIYYVQAEDTCEFSNIDFKSFISGVEGRVKASDPLSIDTIKSESPGLKYTLNNSTFTGLKDCNIIHIQCDTTSKNELTYQYHIKCPRVSITSEYTAIGKFGGFDIDGDGDTMFIADDYIIMLSGKYEKFIGKDGKSRPIITSHTVDINPEGGARFKTTNIVRNNEELSAQIDKFANDNWRLTEKTFRASVLYAFLDKFIEDLNDYSKSL